MIKFIFLLAQLLNNIKQQKASFAILCFLKTKTKNLQDLDYFRALIRFNSGSFMEAREMLHEELRYFPGNKKAKSLQKNIIEILGNKWKTKDPERRIIFEKIESFTMLSEERLNALFDGSKRVLSENLVGSFVECGVAAGGSSALLAHVIQVHSKQPRKMYCFDSFCGMPRATEHDMHEGLTAKRSGWGEGTCAAPVESLLKVARKLGVEQLIVPVPGFFHETLPKYRGKIGRIAVLHLDGDWYESTRDILTNLFELVIPGGYIQIDDYGFWEGCRKAVDEFENANHLKFKKQIIDETGVCFFKE
jgi:O-methyltransferase